MKSKSEVVAQRVLLLIKLDAESLFKRITSRKIEYLALFALKRTRVHFDKIFFNRYREIGLMDIAPCGEESIVAIDAFYNKVDEMEWYLSRTEDMPNTIEDLLDQDIRDLEGLFNTMNLFINAELSVEDPDQ